MSPANHAASDRISLTVAPGVLALISSWGKNPASVLTLTGILIFVDNINFECFTLKCVGCFGRPLVFYHLVLRTCFTTFSFNSKTLRNQFHTTANPNTFPAIPPSEALLSLYMSNWISTANCYFLYKPWQLMPVAQSGWIQVSIFIRLLVESYLGSGLQPVWNSAPVLTGWLWCIRTISWLAKIHFTPSNFLIVF